MALEAVGAFKPPSGFCLRRAPYLYFGWGGGWLGSRAGKSRKFGWSRLAGPRTRAGWLCFSSSTSCERRLAGSMTSKVLEGHTDTVRSVSSCTLHGRMHVISGSGTLREGEAKSRTDDFTVRLWDAETGKAGVVFKGHTAIVNSVSSCTVHERLHLISGSEDKTVRLWDAETGKAGKVFKGHAKPVRSVWSCKLCSREHVISGSFEIIQGRHQQGRRLHMQSS